MLEGTGFATGAAAMNGLRGTAFASAIVNSRRERWLRVLISFCDWTDEANKPADKGTTICPDKSVSTHSGLQTVATGLQVPWAMALAPDGRLFVNERPGRIRVVQNGKLLPNPWRTLGVAATGEMGLLGIAVAPDFVRSKHIFVVGTYRKGQNYVNRVIRLTDVRGRGVNPNDLSLIMWTQKAKVLAPF